MAYTRKKDTIELEVDGQTRAYSISSLPDAFIEWNLGERINYINNKLENNGQKPKHTGASTHLPIYITKNSPNDSFPANAATKGTGFVAKEKYLEFYIEKFKEVLKKTTFEHELSPQELHNASRLRMKTILEFYNNPDHIDFRCLTGLEIWPGVTSRNFRADPRVSVHYLGMPSTSSPSRYQQWQINCIWQETRPGDPYFEFGSAIRELTMGKIGKTIVPGHIPLKNTPARGKYPSGWVLWVIEALDKGLNTGGL